MLDTALRIKSFDRENYLMLSSVRYLILFVNIVIAFEIVSRGVYSMSERFVMMFILGILFLCTDNL